MILALAHISTNDKYISYYIKWEIKSSDLETRIQTMHSYLVNAIIIVLIMPK